MEVIYGLHCNNEFQKPMGIGLGNFDGLHMGHMSLINTLISESKLNNLSSMVYTFTRHPENIIRKKFITPLITTENKKIELLRETPLNYLYFDEFDEEFSRMEPETFVKSVLVDRSNIKLAVAGFDYRFGYRGQGDIELLKDLGIKYGFRVIIIPPVKVDNEIASSTLIRNSLIKGEMDRVFKLLGRYYSISGTVKEGRKVGSTLGFPTANIHPEDYLIIPHDGVYITRTKLEDVFYNSITNVGKNPTFEGITQTSVETHILDFDKIIYGKEIEVFFVSKVRSEKKFKGKDELTEQIRKDSTKAREFFYINRDFMM